jgi:hypothetical protein
MAMVGFGALQALGLWKFADTVTFTAHSPIVLFLVINERTWRSMSPAHRAVIAQAASKVEIEIRKPPVGIRGQGPRLCRYQRREAQGVDARPGGRVARL